jgi:hypothetical protein
MTLRLNGSTSGYTEIDAPAVAGSNTLKLPGGNGTADQALVTDGSGVLSFADRGRMVLGTEQASTSGTSIDFTGIPSWVKRITVMFNGISVTGTSVVLVQIGSGSLTTSGYLGSGCNTSTAATSSSTRTTGFGIDNSTLAGSTRYGTIVITNLSGNNWVSQAVVSRTDSVCGFSSGSVTLSGTLDRIRVTTANGTDTFDAGSINILYEG